jgi:hypothetical protein
MMMMSVRCLREGVSARKEEARVVTEALFDNGVIDATRTETIPVVKMRTQASRVQPAAIGMSKSNVTIRSKTQDLSVPRT